MFDKQTQKVCSQTLVSFAKSYLPSSAERESSRQACAREMGKEVHRPSIYVFSQPSPLCFSSFVFHAPCNILLSLWSHDGSLDRLLTSSQLFLYTWGSSARPATDKIVSWQASLPGLPRDPSIALQQVDLAGRLSMRVVVGISSLIPL